MRPYLPLFQNPHALTVLGNFWPRTYDWAPFPMSSHLYRTDPDTQVLVHTQAPTTSQPLGEVILLHGLEGGGDSGYIVSMAWDALQAGYIAHRFHMRSCGNTAHLCKTLYHAGLTADLRSFIEQRRAAGSTLPIYLIGYSLGANVALKLAGELGDNDLIQGAVAISAPLDLAACSERMGKLDNRIYERRFVKRMKARILSTGRYTPAEIDPLNTLWEIDDVITAPSFGFGNAANYYATQSCKIFLDRIRVPALIVQAKDDTFIPFDIYKHPALRTNPSIRLLTPDHGGHNAFLHRHSPRFWIDEVALAFLAGLPTKPVGITV